MNEEWRKLCSLLFYASATKTRSNHVKFNIDLKIITDMSKCVDKRAQTVLTSMFPLMKKSSNLIESFFNERGGWTLIEVGLTRLEGPCFNANGRVQCLSHEVVCNHRGTKASKMMFVLPE